MSVRKTHLLAMYWGDDRNNTCDDAGAFDFVAAEALDVVKGTNDYFDRNDRSLSTTPVRSLRANPFGLYHMLDKASEWALDYNNPTLEGIPPDGSARSPVTANSASRPTAPGAASQGSFALLSVGWPMPTDTTVPWAFA